MSEPFTPEPWTIRRLANGFWSVSAANGAFICEVPHEETARLIAAAPDLLAALKAASEHLDYTGYGDSWERECAREEKLEERINAAISKATGGKA